MSKSRVLPWLAVIAWAGFIFFMSAQSGDDLQGGEGIISAIFQVLKDLQTSLLGPDVDVISSAAHFLEYAVLGLLLVNALRGHASLRRACLLAIVFASLYGITDEFHQSFVPGRFPDPVDWLVDTCGAALGAVVFVKFRANGEGGRMESAAFGSTEPTGK